MLAVPLSRWLAARNIHYGWVAAAVTFLTMLATAGALGSPGAMLGPLQREFGWQNADISFAHAVRLILFGLMGPFAAALMNRFGVQKIVIVAVSMIATGLIGSLFMVSVWQLVALWGIVVGLGTGMTALVLGATVATRWFKARRGLVVGVMTASNATGQLIFLPLITELTNRIGWRGGLIFIVAMLVLAATLVLLFLRDYPATIGLAPFGATEIVAPPHQDRRLTALLASPIVALREASGSSTFWILFLTFFVCGVSTNGLIQTHWISLCGDFGIAPLGAAGMLAMIGAFDFVGTILSGWLSDRYDNRWLLFWFYGLRGLSLIFLPFTDFTLLGLSLFGVFYGLDWVATVPPTVRLTAERFGVDKANLTFGWIFAAHQLGAASAAFGAGATRTFFATYLPSLFVAGTLCLAAALLVVTLRRHAEPEAQPGPA
jgi:MFS family permease